MMTRDKKHILPLKQVCFTANVSQGFADIVLHQRYENELEQPLEIIFNLPTSENFSCNKIAVDYTLPDGSIDTIETKIVGREKGEQVYEDSIAKGHAAILATLPPANAIKTRKLLKIALGNMPALAKANLRAFCSQKLDIEDESYCFRIPMTYVPAYLGPVCHQLYSEDLNSGFDPAMRSTVQHIMDVESIPVKSQASGLWDIQVTIQGQGAISRVTSLNHPVNVILTPSKTGAIVNLKRNIDRSLVPSSDFVLYIRDQGISLPTVVSTITPSEQQAINLMILPDTRSDRVKQRISSDIRNRQEEAIDISRGIQYARTEEEQLEHQSQLEN